MRILIIEDEVLAFARLSKLLMEVEPSAQVIGHVESIESAVDWLQNNTIPDLILSDIHLADGSSFLIFEKIKVACPIIFTTAYDEYALKAFKLNSIDYLLKPVEKGELRAALEKFKLQNSNGTLKINEAISTLLHTQKTYKERFLVKMADRLIPIATQELSYFASEDKYVMLYHNTKKYPVDFTLEELETLLDPKMFFRLNRKVTTHISAISKISNHLNGKLKVELSPTYSEEIYVSRERAGDFKNWLDGL